ncbi:hypothetical protein CK203_010152 [Vitis vinifera]|uniref:Reverse transcriptase Ty1/copia-type domain-containing protein n=1 Tax=Vitis vinifera TaxID=29760 RepID=A0A438JXA4_VITVI|nr:hypothetical protein CK203_010152 [Vitis vinifera]
MHSEFEMSMIGELNFFLGLQIKQLKEGTFTNQAKYIRDILKKFNMEETKTMKTPMSSSIKLDKDEKGKSMYRGMIGLKARVSVLDCTFFLSHATTKDGLATHGDGFKVDFPTLVRAFYSRTTYGIGGPIISIIRGVEIRLDPENIYHIFNIAPIGLKVYESKI